MKYDILKALQLQDFDNDQELSAEYSVFRGCSQSDSGYHCSHYDGGEECDICGQEMSEEENEIARTD